MLKAERKIGNMMKRYKNICGKIGRFGILTERSLFSKIMSVWVVHFFTTIDTNKKFHI